MAKVQTKAVFKSINQYQTLLFPPSLDELIPENDLVRIVSQVVDTMDLSQLLNQYKGGGTSSYHPRMLLKVLLYSYCNKVYTGRKIAKAIRQNINYMWLAGMSQPDFRTINLFRSSRAKEVIETIFQEMLGYLMEKQYIQYENYFCDGTYIIADCNKNKMIWKKNAERYKVKIQEKCKVLFKQIDTLNTEENIKYGGKDLEELGLEITKINQEEIKQQAQKLTKKLETATSKKEKLAIKRLEKEANKYISKLDKYDAQINKSNTRSGYNKTDEDASAMMMKNKVEVLPAYNVMAGSENQFITGLTVHQNSNDGRCFKEHIEKVIELSPKKPENIVADSIFGTEHNYELIEKEKIENYMKFPTFHNENKKKTQGNPFLKENFKYAKDSDSYICPNEKRLIYKETKKDISKSGYEATVKKYECQNCNGCPFYDQCCKTENGKNRTIYVNENLERHKQKARENLKSEKGEKKRKQRSIEIESCFGDIKHNMEFRRFHLRGKEKVHTEMSLIAMAHNLRKMHLKLKVKVA